MITATILSCKSTLNCSTKFSKKAIEEKEYLRKVCSYIIELNYHKGFISDRVFDIDSIKNVDLFNKLDQLNVGTIYILNKKIYDYSFPQDSVIVFAKRYHPLKSKKHEYIIFSYASNVDIPKLNNPSNEKLCNISSNVFYYSWR